jgi:hypothetical protein
MQDRFIEIQHCPRCMILSQCPLFVKAHAALDKAVKMLPLAGIWEREQTDESICLHCTKEYTAPLMKDPEVVTKSSKRTLFRGLATGIMMSNPGLFVVCIRDRISFC